MIFNTHPSPFETSLPLNLKGQPHILELVIMTSTSCLYFQWPLRSQPNNTNVFIPYCLFALFDLSITITKPSPNAIPWTHSSKASRVGNTHNKIHYMIIIWSLQILIQITQNQFTSFVVKWLTKSWPSKLSNSNCSRSDIILTSSDILVQTWSSIIIHPRLPKWNDQLIQNSPKVKMEKLTFRIGLNWKSKYNFWNKLSRKRNITSKLFCCGR